MSSGSRARAYKLAYAISPNTGRSELVNVQQFGRDAAVDAAGTVTGTSSLPAMTFGYQQNPGTFTNSQPSYGGWNFGSAPDKNYTLAVGDFNG